MKRRKLLCVLLTVLLIGVGALTASAGNSTANTYTISVDNEWIKTQDAYLPGQIFFKEDGMKKPSDIVIAGGKMYVADTENSRILIRPLYDPSAQTTVFGEGVLSAPSGLYVAEDGTVYVADTQKKEILVLSAAGEVLLTIGEPNSPMFGADAMWEPSKVVADKLGNIYVMSQGGFNGLVQFSRTGDYLGYFGSNQTSKTFVETLQDIFFTPEQIAQLFNRKPAAFTNMAIDADGLIYTITADGQGNVVKKHNVAGSNVLAASKNRVMHDDPNFADIAVGRWGQIFVVSTTGVINEYDYNGHVHFSFGGQSKATDLNGLFTVPSGIAVDDNDCVYVLDYEKGVVQSFYPTAFANMTHEALRLYDSGRYEESKAYWQQVMQLSGSSRVVHQGLGQCYMNLGDYDNAATHFRISGDRAAYSDAYWELRDRWISENAVLVMIGVVVLVAGALVLMSTQKRRPKAYVYSPYRCPPGEGLVGDLKFMLFSMRHPIDAALYIKSGQKVSTLSAFVVGALGVAVYLIDYACRGFIFNTADSNAQIPVLLVTAIVPVVLWAVCNYMIATLHAGDGKFRAVFHATVYAFCPYIFITPFVTLLSQVLTQDEGFLLNLAATVSLLWVGLNLFLFTKKVHDFTFWETIKNIVVTLFLILVILIAAALVYSLWNSIADFFDSIYREVFYRGLDK